MECIRNFGYTANIELTLGENVRRVLKNMHPAFYFNKVKNMSFHNLCTHKQPPPNLKATLGLGVKFCIQQDNPIKNVNKTIERLRRDVQIKLFFANHQDNNSSYIPELYLPSEWIPDHVNQTADELIDKFEEQLLYAKSKLPKKKHSNLTRIQKKTINFLHNHPDFIVFLADKNLGPAIIERDEYIRRALKDHLNDHLTYERLEKETALWDLFFQRNQILAFAKKHEKTMQDGEITFFKRFLFQEKFRTPQFYITAKVHKSPWKTRPIVSTSGSLMAFLSKWVDYQLNSLAKQSPTYISNSKQVKKELESLHRLPENAVLFSADAVSMYTNIDTEHGIETISKYLREFHADLINIDAIIEGLGLVMRNNIFQFGDCYFKQNLGTAMGTPVASAYATLYYSYHERKTLLANFGHALKYLKRYIDDSLGILILDKKDPDLLNRFQEAWTFGKLNWTFEMADKGSINFLDITVFKNESDELLTKSYEKPLNLHLYIPNNSAHTPGVLKGMIYGNLRRFKEQNSRKEDYLAIAKKFHTHLLNRGYTKEKITPIFLEAVKSFEKTEQKMNISKESMKNNVFLHFQYHPRDISRQQIQSIFNKTCMKENIDEPSLRHLQDDDPPLGNGGLLQLERATLAYSRAPNIRDKVCPSTLYQPPGQEVSTFLSPTI